MDLDAKDLNILKRLQANADISNAALAKAVDLSPSACLMRVRQLKQNGLIRKIRAALDAEQLGYRLHVLVHIKLSSQSKETLNYFEGLAKRNPWIQACFRMTGEYDYSFRLLIRDTKDLEFFLTNELGRVPNLASTRTEVAMKCIKLGEEVDLA